MKPSVSSCSCCLWRSSKMRHVINLSNFSDFLQTAGHINEATYKKNCNSIRSSHHKRHFSGCSVGLTGPDAESQRRGEQFLQPTACCFVRLQFFIADFRQQQWTDCEFVRWLVKKGGLCDLKKRHLCDKQVILTVDHLFPECPSLLLIKEGTTEDTNLWVSLQG